MLCVFSNRSATAPGERASNRDTKRKFGDRKIPC